jgi:hypothetical protein
MTNGMGETTSRVGRAWRVPKQILSRKDVDLTTTVECGHDDQWCWHFCVSCRGYHRHAVSKGGAIDRYFRLCKECKAAGRTENTWKPG